MNSDFSTARNPQPCPLPWMVSLHGGHSVEFCDHAIDSLREMLQAAVTAGYHTFGVSEHAPRNQARFLYPEERRRGWDVTKTQDDFARYAVAVSELAGEFANRLVVLRGFEAEVVPAADYARIMRAYREQKLPDDSPAFDYCVGSVHYVDELQIDGDGTEYAKAIEAFGSLEALAIRYYETVGEMVETLRPEVVGHFDLIKKNTMKVEMEHLPLDTPPIRKAANIALEAVRAQNSILDLNTAGWRKGLGEPYPAPWLVSQANAMGIPFCFGDDSHRLSDVGMGLRDARDYLRRLGVNTITVLTRDGDPVSGPVVRRVVSLE